MVFIRPNIVTQIFADGVETRHRTEVCHVFWLLWRPVWLPSSSGQPASYTWCGMTSTSAAPTGGWWWWWQLKSVGYIKGSIHLSFYLSFLQVFATCLSHSISARSVSNAPTVWADSPGNTGHAACFCHTTWSQRHPGPSFLMPRLLCPRWMGKAPKQTILPAFQPLLRRKKTLGSCWTDADDVKIHVVLFLIHFYH